MTKCSLSVNINECQIQNNGMLHIHAVYILQVYFSNRWTLMSLHVLQTTCSIIMEYNDGYVHAHEMRDEMGY